LAAVVDKELVVLAAVDKEVWMKQTLVMQEQQTQAVVVVEVLHKMVLQLQQVEMVEKVL
jgi:hypothetical protein